ncbi:hypothetical protein KP509_12G091500 [Ceratopteris richardii]|uniref:Uncharacterized protein n=1 Tax=Ceratopteris richardii TaxID=49495 RepID=A0A8T2TL41_CERRI|nr:hypothetical protein KP509_12G091500 [Ceratopteris richardii]
MIINICAKKVNREECIDESRGGGVRIYFVWLSALWSLMLLRVADDGGLETEKIEDEEEGRKRRRSRRKRRRRFRDSGRGLLVLEYPPTAGDDNKQVDTDKETLGHCNAFEQICWVRWLWRHPVRREMGGRGHFAIDEKWEAREQRRPLAFLSAALSPRFNHTGLKWLPAGQLLAP